MVKKIVIGIILITLIAIGGLFAINGKDNYDATKYFTSASNGLNVGSKIDFTLPDQFDKSHSLSDDTQKIIFAFAKSTGHTVREFLKKQDKNYLTDKKALFVADISPMPTIIRNTFALPDLKKSDYSVLLIYDKEIAKKLKDDKNSDKIAIATLKNKEITKMDYVTTQKELEDKLK